MPDSKNDQLLTPPPLTNPQPTNAKQTNPTVEGSISPPQDKSAPVLQPEVINPVVSQESQTNSSGTIGPRPQVEPVTPQAPSRSLGSNQTLNPTSGDDGIKKSPFKLVGPIVGIVAVLGLVVFVVTKLFNKKDEAPPNITLTYWGLWEPNQAIKKVFTDFETQNPGITINYVLQSHKEYRERLQAAIQREEGPDIFRFHNTWTPMMKNELANLPKDIMSTSEFETTFYPITQKDLKIGTNYVGIPLEFDGLALYYNVDIFKNANKTPPTTWEELRQVALALTLRDEEERIIRSGAALGTASNVDHWSDILGLMILQNAANPADPTDELAQDSLAFYTIFTKTDRVWDETLPSSTTAFANQKTAMMIAPSWRAFDVKNLNPSLNFATVPVPQLPNTSIYWASYWAEGVSKKSSAEKQEAAWKLLKFLSQPENLRAFYNEASNVRLFGEPYPRMDMAEELADDPVVGAYITTAKNARSWWLASWTHDNGLNDHIMKYYEDAVNAVNKGSSVKKALSTTAEGVVQVLSQFGVSGALR